MSKVTPLPTKLNQISEMLWRVADRLTLFQSRLLMAMSFRQEQNGSPMRIQAVCETQWRFGLVGSSRQYLNDASVADVLWMEGEINLLAQKQLITIESTRELRLTSLGSEVVEGLLGFEFSQNEMAIDLERVECEQQADIHTGI